MIIKRDLEKKLKGLAKKFPVIGIFGPRQSGKTTLSKIAFNKHKFVSLEDYKTKELAKSDLYAFFNAHHNKYGIVLDEIQEVPELLSYIKVYSDEHNKPGYFILTGSQNFLINETVTQTLAGRIAITTLLPFSINELKKAKQPSKILNKFIFKGQYPKVTVQKALPIDWYPNYIRTYVQRDVRQIKNVTDLSLFQKFMGLCAGRIGQLLNITSLANDCGIGVNTVKSWLSVLEASYIIFLLQPHYKNFNKRLVKTPKLYFYDTGLACSFLGIDSSDQLINHYLRGGIFESLIISDLLKYHYNLGLIPHVYFFRDNVGHEIDCIIERGTELIRIEIKSGQTINPSFFDNLDYWNKLAKKDDYKNNFIVYAGLENQKRSKVKIVAWNCVDKIF